MKMIISWGMKWAENGIRAGHNETYCVDEFFDTGVRNYTAKKALRITQTNAVDYYGYWKLFDALIACTLNDRVLKKLLVTLPVDPVNKLLSEKE